MKITEDSQLLGNLKEIKLNELVEQEYKTYQMYTLYDRAIPYLVDGLKPAQRRILYTLYKNMNKGLMKVSSATGLVLSLHPHGPPSIESGIVNMAQDYAFANNYPLIDKKGYFGERMETNPAASRYIECKLAKMTERLLFDDLNQVNMVLNYDEKILEPEFLLPKLPIMLLNGAEGIGTGFSSLIPSFHHKDIIDSMIQYVKTGKAKKIKPWVNHYTDEIVFDKEKKKFIFTIRIEKIKDSFFITELPKNYDSKKIYATLGKLIEEEYLKDYIDSSEKNTIKIELIFKKGNAPTLAKIIEKMNITSSLVPNYTLINDDGVITFDNPEDIIELFAEQRLIVTKRRYELKVKDTQDAITKNNEIIRFIKDKHYAQAESKKNRADYVDYLKKNKFVYFDYLAEMAIYRLTKEEVERRQLLVSEDSKKIKEYKRILSSKTLIQEQLFAELAEVNDMMNAYLREKNKDK